VGVREAINRRPAVAAGILVGVLVIIVVSLASSGSRSEPERSQPPKTRFTVDDGKTWFPDEANKIPPFPHAGGIAVRCIVQRCPDGTEWAAYLMRYTAAGKRQLERPQSPTNLDPSATAAMRDMVEVKPPGGGDDGWVPLRHPKATAIKTPSCPHGLNNHAGPLN
jgi:hypothetical protein